MKAIVQKENPILRQKAKDVPIKEINTPKIKKIIAEMKQAMDSQEDGVAIAAPQIGYDFRIFLVSDKIGELIKKYNEEDDLDLPSPKIENLIYINPVVKKLSKDKKFTEEGCLSVRYLYGQVKRATKATVEAYDENGKKFTKGASGLLAQIFQHETDHLNGILFTDKAKNVEEIIPEHLTKK